MKQKVKSCIGKSLLFLSGWKISYKNINEKAEHCVIVAAPHTSNWDILYSMASLWALKIPVSFLIKDSYTKSWFFGPLVRFIGGIGVNRSQKTNLVQVCAEILKNNKKIAIMLSPEGTRSFVSTWKKGFYNIAKEANVPIALAFLDYKTKTAGILNFYNPQLQYDEILAQMRTALIGIEGKIPKNWNPEFN